MLVDAVGDPAPGHCDKRPEEAGRTERVPGLCDTRRARLLLRPGAGGVIWHARQCRNSRCRLTNYQTKHDSAFYLHLSFIPPPLLSVSLAWLCVGPVNVKHKIMVRVHVIM